MSLFSREPRKRWRVYFDREPDKPPHGHTSMRGTESGVRCIAHSMHPNGPSGHVRLVELDKQ